MYKTISSFMKWFFFEELLPYGVGTGGTPSRVLG
jgi:hypothetical protein